MGSELMQFDRAALQSRRQWRGPECQLCRPPNGLAGWLSPSIRAGPQCVSIGPYMLQRHVLRYTPSGRLLWAAPRVDDRPSPLEPIGRFWIILHPRENLVAPLNACLPVALSKYIPSFVQSSSEGFGIGALTSFLRVKIAHAILN